MCISVSDADPYAFCTLRLWYMMLFQSKRLGRAYLSHSDYERLEAWLRKSPQGVKRAEAISDQVSAANGGAFRAMQRA